MCTNEFGEAFSAFLESGDYEEAENDFFSIVRVAFEAGWIAAGGAYPVPEHLLSFPKPEKTPADE